MYLSAPISACPAIPIALQQLHRRCCVHSIWVAQHKVLAVCAPDQQQYCIYLTQVEKDMIEVLQQKWVEGHLAALREEVKKYEK